MVTLKLVVDQDLAVRHVWPVSLPPHQSPMAPVFALYTGMHDSSVNHQTPYLVFHCTSYWLQGFDSPQQPQLSGPKSPQWVKPDNHLPHTKSPQHVNIDNKENALPEPSSASRKSPGSHMPGSPAYCISPAVTGGCFPWYPTIHVVCELDSSLPR